MRWHGCVVGREVLGPGWPLLLGCKVAGQGRFQSSVIWYPTPSCTCPQVKAGAAHAYLGDVAAAVEEFDAVLQASSSARPLSGAHLRASMAPTSRQHVL